MKRQGAALGRFPLLRFPTSFVWGAATFVGCRCDALSGDLSNGHAPSASATHDPRFDADMIPSLDVPRLTEEEAASIVIDGVLDEPAWKTAASTGRFVDVGSGKVRRDLPVGGEAELLASAKGLYVGFEVDDTTVRGGFPENEIDPHLWERDTVELMIDPEGDGDNKDYYEIQVNPQNLVFDSRFDDYNLPHGGPSGPFGHQEWHADMRSEVKVHGTIDDDSDVDRGYTVELFIDFESLGGKTRFIAAPGAPAKTIRANLYAVQDNGGVAWSPILGAGNFHKASRFGRLRFIGERSLGDASSP